MLDSCFICMDKPLSAYSCIKSVTLSRRSVLRIANSVLTLPIIDVNSITCQICFDIIDEIDVFEHNLEKAKSRLQKRREPIKEDFKGLHQGDFVKRIEESKNVQPQTNGKSLHPIFIDRLLTKTRWKSQEKFKNNNEFKELIQDFEEDLIDLVNDIPKRLSCQKDAELWIRTLLKTETGAIDLNIPNESKCFLCSRSFATVQDQINHINSSHQTTITRCTNCNQDFSDESLAHEHLLQTHNILPRLEIPNARNPIRFNNNFQCSKCDLEFYTELSYWFHHYKRHRKSLNLSKCQFCPSLFHDLSVYRRHVLIKHCQYVFQCFACPETFEEESGQSLIKHIRSHYDNSEQVEQASKFLEAKNEDFIDGCDYYEAEQEEYNSVEKRNEEKSDFVKKSTYISKTLARSFRSEPLSTIEHFKV